MRTRSPVRGQENQALSLCALTVFSSSRPSMPEPSARSINGALGLASSPADIACTRANASSASA